jgi:hypothetical protein
MTSRSSLSRTVRATILALGLALAAPAVAAEPRSDAESESDRERRAGQLFGEGQTAFEAGDFRRAATLFEQAYAAKPHHNVLWNAARSWQRAGEEALTANDLERYLREGGADAPHRDEATKTLAEIMKRVGRVQLQRVRMRTVRIDGSATSETTVYVAPGEHVAAGTTSAGEPVRKVFDVRAGETVSVILGGAEKKDPAPPAEAPEPESSKPLSPWFVVGGAVLTAAAGGVSALSGLDTVEKAHAYDRSMTVPNYNVAVDAQLRTNVVLGVTGGLAAVTVVLALFFVDWNGHKASSGPKRGSASDRGGRGAGPNHAESCASGADGVWRAPKAHLCGWWREPQIRW